MTPSNDRRRYFLEGLNNSGRVFGLEGSNIRTVVDGDGMTIMMAKCNESGIVARRHVRRRGIEVTIDIVDVARERREDKDLGARARRSRRGGGRKGCPGGRGFFSRIHRRRWK
jgi:hypothetical protein